MSYETALAELEAEMARYKAANDYVEAYVAKHPTQFKLWKPKSQPTTNVAKKTEPKEGERYRDGFGNKYLVLATFEKDNQSFAVLAPKRKATAKVVPFKDFAARTLTRIEEDDN